MAAVNAAARADVVYDATGGSPAETILSVMPETGTFVRYGLLSGQTFRQQRPLPRVAWFHIRNYLDALSAEAWQAEFRRIWPKLRASQCSDVTLYPLSEWQRAVGNYREAGRTASPCCRWTINRPYGSCRSAVQRYFVHRRSARGQF